MIFSFGRMSFLRRQATPAHGRVQLARPQVRVVRVCAAQQPEMSKSKLGRLKKDELLAMLADRGITAEGRKQELVDLIWEHDYGKEEVANMGVSNQASAVPTARVARMDDAEQAIVKRLRDDIEELNRNLDNVRNELKMNASKHDQEQAFVNQLMDDLENVKNLWANNLQDIGNKMETAVKLQVSQEEIAQLQAKQKDLEEGMRLQQRLLEARDQEVKLLAETLEQLRREAAEAERARKQEQLAMLALAGSAAAGGVPPTTPAPSWMPQWTSAPAPPTPSAPSAPRSFSISVLPSEPVIPRYEKARQPEHQVFSMALPGLAAVYAARMLGGRIFDSYLTVRNVLVRGGPERQLVDLAVAVAALSALVSALS